jgi:hypothetical protein
MMVFLSCVIDDVAAENQRRDQKVPRRSGAQSEYALFRLFLLMTETQ